MNRFLQIKTSTGIDGLGTPSVSVFFSYCDKPTKCLGCHNKELQKDGVGFNLRIETAREIINTKLKFLKRIYNEVKLVFIGGEPLAKINLRYCQDLARSFPEYTKLVYTWRGIAELKGIDISMFDEVVCGEYVEKLKTENKLLGSSNQYIVDNKLNVTWRQ